jgi:endonuclease/exonuclease/phosphatase family metal-dependent hydrolase
MPRLLEEVVAFSSLTRPSPPSQVRMPRLLEEVVAFDADVVLLQEVDQMWHRQHWAPAMAARGYTPLFTRKAHPSSREGLAAFVRTAAFDVVHVAELPLALDAADAPAALHPLLATHASTAEGVAALPTVAQLLLLRQTAPSAPSARYLLVANTHLYFSNPGMHVRVMQLTKLLHHAHEMASALPPADAPALVVAGDLNSEAGDAALRLLTTGLVEAHDPDWLHGALNWAPSISLTAAARKAALGAAAAVRSCAGTYAEVEGVWAAYLGRVEAAETQMGFETPSLGGAQRTARELHLLRRAIETVLARGSGGRSAEAAAPTSLRGLSAAIVRDAAAGHSLLNSAALAAAEVARQLRLPLGAMAEGDSLGSGEPPSSWYTQGNARLALLTHRLLATKEALRAAVAAEGSSLRSSPRSSDLGAEIDEACDRWARQAAGARISQPTPLQSAYGLHKHPTHVVPGYANTLDWICVDAARLDVVGLAPLPPLEELTRDVAMPSAEWPSDHVSLCCDLRWRDPAEVASSRAAARAAPHRASRRPTAAGSGQPNGAQVLRDAQGQGRATSGSSSWIWRT